MVDRLPDTLAVPILRQFVPDGIDYGASILIEFEPDSLWYETSLTITAQALREGVKTIYHTFSHAPRDVERALARLGLDGRKLKNDGLFELIDSYSVQTGLAETEKLNNVTTEYALIESLKLQDWSISYSQAIKAGITEKDKRWLHIDDDVSIMTKYNSENAFIEFTRTRGFPMTRATETIALDGVSKGAESDSFLRQSEAVNDGIVDLKAEEIEGEIEQKLRVRLMRSKRFDSKWHTLKLQDNGEVTLD
jgi:KaiC/GvpD/RAD55 family RecA-like ATPase